MRKQFKKLITVLSVVLAVALLLTVFSACGKKAESDQAGSASTTLAPTATPTPSVSPTPTAEPSASPAAAGRKDGERFESVITIEGMEETVHYEHIRNESIGFEMDYDYENFQRRSEADRECFISVWDDAANPENYLEVKHLSQDAETAAASIVEELSDRYDVGRSTFTLEKAGECIQPQPDDGSASDDLCHPRIRRLLRGHRALLHRRIRRIRKKVLLYDAHLLPHRKMKNSRKPIDPAARTGSGIFLYQ